MWVKYARIVSFGPDNGVGKHMLTPRYCFLAQNAFYGLVASLPRE